MAKRAGVGATVAAAVIFSIVLASSYTVYYSAREDARLHSVSNGADALADEDVVFEGAGAANILLKEQAFLESNILECGSAVAASSAAIGRLTDIQTSANLTVLTSATPALQGPASDNLSMLAPFGGFVAGFLDTALHEVAKGDDSALGVSFSRNETHYVHLSVRIGAMAGDCDRALSGIRGAVSSTIPRNCTGSVVSPLIAVAATGAASKAMASGFRFAVDSAVVGVAPCTVQVTVTIAQNNVPGLAGDFSVELRQEEVVAFEQ
jgi:hypothetical protein